MRLSVRTLAVLLFANAAVTNARSFLAPGRKLRDTDAGVKSKVTFSGPGSAVSSTTVDASDDPDSRSFVEVDVDTSGSASARLSAFARATRFGQSTFGSGKSITEGTSSTLVIAEADAEEDEAQAETDADGESGEDGRTKVSSLAKAESGTKRAVSRSEGGTRGEASVIVDGEAIAVADASAGGGGTLLSSEEGGTAKGKGVTATKSDGTKTMTKFEASSRDEASGLVTAVAVGTSDIATIEQRVDADAVDGQAKGETRTFAQSAMGQIMGGGTSARISGTGSSVARGDVAATDEFVTVDAVSTHVETDGESRGAASSGFVADSGQGQTLGAQLRSRTSGDSMADSAVSGTAEEGSVSVSSRSSASSGVGGFAHSYASIAGSTKSELP